MTKSKKSVKLYTDNVLDAFYEAIRTNSLDRLHIPHSDVFYVRQAVEAHYGRPFTLKHVEDAMRAEGWKEPNELTFRAMIIVCHVANNAMCMTITDNRGPYDTSEKCEARIEEMIGDLISSCGRIHVLLWYLSGQVVLTLLSKVKVHLRNGCRISWDKVSRL